MVRSLFNVLDEEEEGRLSSEIMRRKLVIILNVAPQRISSLFWPSGITRQGI